MYGVMFLLTQSDSVQHHQCNSERLGWDKPTAGYLQPTLWIRTLELALGADWVRAHSSCSPLKGGGNPRGGSSNFRDVYCWISY